MKSLTKLTLAALLLSLSACGSTSNKGGERPSWIDNPGQFKGGLMAVGEANVAVSDPIGQAKDRALAELSRQMKDVLSSAIEVSAIDSESTGTEISSEVINESTAASLRNVRQFAAYRGESVQYVLMGISDPSQIKSLVVEQVKGKKGKVDKLEPELDKAVSQVQKVRKSCGY